MCLTFNLSKCNPRTRAECSMSNLKDVKSFSEESVVRKDLKRTPVFKVEKRSKPYGESSNKLTYKKGGQVAKIKRAKLEE